MKILTAVMVATFSLQSCLEGGCVSDLEMSVNYIANKTASDVEKKIPSLKLIGVGGSMKDQVIVHEKLVFNHYGKLNERKAVALLSKIVDVYLNNFYSDRNLKWYLNNHCFGMENLRIVFLVYDTERKEVLKPDISTVRLEGGVVSFLTIEEPKKDLIKTTLIHKEPFKEAATRYGVWNPAFEPLNP